MNRQISFTLNGETVAVTADPMRVLADVLREDFQLTGTKTACRTGDCGACTVLMNGQAVNSCLIPIGMVEGSAIMTIEGLGGPECPHPVQTAFIDQGAVQCGYCLPGMILAAKALLDENPNPASADIREGMAGNLCRCTGYVKIEKAVLQAAESLRQGGASK
jgi:carbon-monoxide dehydrogenase small subunit